MGRLIDDLLHLSRMGRKELVKHPLDMDAFVEGFIKEQVEINALHPIEIKKEKLLQISQINQNRKIFKITLMSTQLVTY